MPTAHLSILVVDDAKFSSAMIGRALSQAGYLDVRFASSAAEALQLLEQRRASIILADWLMPEINGLQLTEHVRQLDESANHYTYVILLTGKEGENVLGEAFDGGVDDFINKAVMNEQLVPRVYAADRLCNSLQRLLLENRRLSQTVAHLEARNLVDPATGLGNSRYLKQKLHDSLRQIESRGGALCYLVLELQDAQALRQQHGRELYHELLNSVARRLQQLVRPLDVLVRLDAQQFALLTLLNDLQECAPGSFKRVHDGINHKAFKTSQGFITLKAGISLVGVDAKGLPCTPDHLMQLAHSQLAEAHSSGRVTALRLPLTH
jgi:diguanylate cyclase (GGDEF)-like protein